MTTPARIDANRRNALKSTGPRTPHGKAQTSRNAFKHGLRSKSALLPGEDPGEFYDFLDRLGAEFPPASPSQEMLLDQMAAAYWKLARLQRIERAVYALRSRKSEMAGILRQIRSRDGAPEPPPPSPDEALGAAYLRDANGCRAFRSLSNDEGRLERSFFRAFRELTKPSQSSLLPSTNPSVSSASSSPPQGAIAPPPPPAGQ
jgi:hypothetical protein